MTSPQGRIDQVAFGWDLQTGRLSVLASSFDRRQEEKVSLHHLQSYIRLQPLRDARVPQRALSYFQLPDGKAALLHRVDAGISTGRNYSHGLIGPAELLTPQIGLGMSNWEGWLANAPGGTPLDLVSAQSLAVYAQRADQSLFPVAAGATAALKPVLAGLLGAPGVPVSVIGCQEDLKLAMVWALYEIADHHRLDLADRTFSTYEHQHHAGMENAPHIIFLPARPYEMTDARRTIVDLGRASAAGPEMQTAELLCGQLVNRDFAPPVPARRAPRLEQTQRIDPRRHRPSQPLSPSPSPSSPEALVAALRHADTVREFDSLLARLRQCPYEHRHRVRKALDAAALGAAAHRIEVTFRGRLLRDLLEAAYGPGLEDLAEPSAQKHAARVVQRADSEELAMLVGSAEALTDPQVAVLAARRWAGRPRRESLARMAERLRTGRNSRYLPLAVTIAVLGLLCVVFLGGILLGSSRGSEAQSAPRLPAGRIAGGYARVNPAATPEMMLVAFIRSADATLRPEGPCIDTGSSLWFCPSRGDLPPDRDATLVAYLVPREQADGVLAADAVAPGLGWSGQITVR